MVLALMFLAGVFFGVGAVVLVYRAYYVGNLRIDRSDPSEPPYIFLELEKGVGDISRKKNVILKVSNKNYISQK